jgi:hypothetical protein
MSRRASSLLSSLTLALIFAVASGPLSAHWLTGSELRQHCASLPQDPQSPGAMVCISYVQGFIGGAQTWSDAINPPTSGAGVAARKSYTERAAQTRVGSRLRQQTVFQGNGYCIGEDTSATRIAATVAAHLQQYGMEQPAAPAYRLVHEALTTNFPC